MLKGIYRNRGNNMELNYSDCIRRLRAMLNLSQQGLAEMFGVSFVSVNRWENGHFEPTIIVKEKLKELFKKNNIEVEIK